MVRSVVWATACLLCASMAAAEDAASEFELGHQEYLTACSACHGEAADGNGQIAPMFKTRVPDLRKIASANDGVFPLLDVIHMIDGRTAIRAHGNPMPVFGQRYSTEAEETSGMGAEMIARGRVLELALYLQSIQE